VKQLKKERDRVQQQLSGLNAALEAFAGVYRGNNGTRPRRKMSAEGRARIAAAQRARWARVKGNSVTAAKPVKRTMSAIGFWFGDMAVSDGALTNNSLFR